MSDFVGRSSQPTSRVSHSLTPSDTTSLHLHILAHLPQFTPPRWPSMARPQTRKRQRADDPPPDQVLSKKPKSTGRFARPPKQQNRTSRADDLSYNPAPTTSANPRSVFPALLGAKRQADNSPQDQSPSKKPRSSGAADTSSNFPPEFYDNLSKVWLTRRALRELDRRNQNLPLPKRATHSKHIEDFPLAARKCGPDLARFARTGGPDLSDLQGVCRYRQSLVVID